MLVGAVVAGAVVAELALDLRVDEQALGPEGALGEVGAVLGRVEERALALVVAVWVVATLHFLKG